MLLRRARNIVVLCAVACFVIACADGGSPSSLQSEVAWPGPAGADRAETAHSHHEGAKKSDWSSFGTGRTLLGGIILVTLLFELTNWRDADIRLYVWSITSTTLSIFMAVMIFVGVRDAIFSSLAHYGIELEEGGKVKIVLLYCLFLVWFLMMYVVILVKSEIHIQDEEGWNRIAWLVVDPLSERAGDEVPEAFVTRSGYMGVADLDGVKIFVERRYPRAVEVERQTTAWSTLFAHMAGFASMAAASELQEADFLKGRPWLAYGVVLWNMCFLLFLFEITARLRPEEEDPAAASLAPAGRAGSRPRASALMVRAGEVWQHDSMEPELPAPQHLMFNKAAEEAEDDMLCLATSFLLVQAIRFSLTGVLQAEGIEEPELVATVPQIIGLYVFGLCFAALTAPLIGCSFAPEKSRWVGIALNTAAMSFAWCFLWATVWLSLWVERWEHPDTKGDFDTLESRLQESVLVSGLAMLFIWVLDHLEDMLHDHLRRTGAAGQGHDYGVAAHRAQRAVQMVITALSILVGFSWERTFDGGVEALASRMQHSVIAKLTLTVVVVLILVPTWRRHIRVRVIDLRARREVKKRAGGRAGSSPWLGGFGVRSPDRGVGHAWFGSFPA